MKFFLILFSLVSILLLANVTQASASKGLYGKNTDKEVSTTSSQGGLLRADGDGDFPGGEDPGTGPGQDEAPVGEGSLILLAMASVYVAKRFYDRKLKPFN